jgi:hypothetical protein
MRPLFFILTLVLFTTIAAAQSGREVHGTVLDSTKLSLPGSSIKLVSDKGDSTFSIADAKGNFVFSSVKGTKLTLTVSSIGFLTLKKHYALDNGTAPVNLGTIVLSLQTNMLNQVNVVGVSPVSLKEDTVEYKVSAYKVRENAPVEDVLKKLPGVDVDANGNVSAQGKQITKVRVNGKDFFGGDVQTATKNLPADVVESIQVIDDYGDQANLTGVKTGEPNKILNITIRKDKNYGYFGQATAGDGEDWLPKNPGVTNDNRYLGVLNTFKFNGDQQIAVLGNINNTNVNTFSFNAPGGGGGGGGFGGGGGGRGNALRGGGAAGLTTNANGITLARSIGGNYRDQWGKKISVYGSYSFSDFSTYTQSSTLQTNNFQTPSTSSSTGNQHDNPINHRFAFNLEYKPDTINYLKLTPNFSYGSTNTNDIENVISTRNGKVNQAYSSVSNNNSQAPNFGITALYNHRFNGHGRNLSINVNANSSRNTAYDNPVYDYTAGVHTVPLNQQIYTNSRTTTLGSNISYLEPLSKLSYLEFNYALNHSYTTSDKQTDTLSTANTYNNYSFLSNNYNYTFVTNRFGLNYRFVQKKYNYTLGIAVQPGTLSGQSLKSDSTSNTRINTFNVIPTARFIYNFSRGRAFSVNYNGSSNQPSFNQLQPVIDFSNALYPVQGNPNLKPEFNNSFNLRYNNFSFQTGNIFFTNFQFTQTNNKIVTYTITYPSRFLPAVLTSTPALKRLQNTNLTNYLNTDGYYLLSGSVLYAKPWSERKFTLILNGNVNYTNNIGYSSSVDSTNASSAIQKNIAKTLTINPGVRFRVDVTNVIDAQLSTNYAINRTVNSITDGIYGQNTNIRTLTLGLSGKNYFWKDWTLSYDYSKQFNYGYASTIKVTNPNLLNTYVERRFLKDNRGTLRLSAFDLFNQNTGFSTTTNGSIVTQSNVNRLGRYYLLSFTYRVQKFAGKAPAQGGGRNGGGPGRGDRGAGGGPGGHGGGTD